MSIWKRFNRGYFLVALMVMGGGYVVWNWFHPAQFKAKAVLLLDAQAPKILSKTVETESRDDYQRFKRTQQQLVTSRLALMAALQDKEVSTYRMIREQVDPIAWLQANVKVELPAASELMEISLSGEYPDELAGIVNAVTKGYMEEFVNRDAKTRAERHDALKKLNEQYAEMLRERRETLRKRSGTVASDNRIKVTGLERPELLRLHHELWMQRIILQLEQANAETLLARRKEAAGSATDPVLKEIEGIEDRRAGLIAQEKLLDERLEQMTGEIRKAVSQGLEQEQLKAEIAAMEDVARKVAAEVETLNIELQAPSRIRTIENAVPPRLRGGITNAAL